MTEIAAELRRSATEDRKPFARVREDAWLVARRFLCMFEHMCNLPDKSLRTFYLIVACALEDE